VLTDAESGLSGPGFEGAGVCAGAREPVSVAAAECTGVDAGATGAGTALRDAPTKAFVGELTTGDAIAAGAGTDAGALLTDGDGSAPVAPFSEAAAAPFGALMGALLAFPTSAASVRDGRLLVTGAGGVRSAAGGRASIEGTTGFGIDLDGEWSDLVDRELLCSADDVREMCTLMEDDTDDFAEPIVAAADAFRGALVSGRSSASRSRSADAQGRSELSAGANANLIESSDTGGAPFEEGATSGAAGCSGSASCHDDGDSAGAALAREGASNRLSVVPADGAEATAAGSDNSTSSTKSNDSRSVLGSGAVAGASGTAGASAAVVAVCSRECKRGASDSASGVPVRAFVRLRPGRAIASAIRTGAAAATPAADAAAVEAEPDFLGNAAVSIGGSDPPRRRDESAAAGSASSRAPAVAAAGGFAAASGTLVDGDAFAACLCAGSGTSMREVAGSPLILAGSGVLGSGVAVGADLAFGGGAPIGCGGASDALGGGSLARAGAVAFGACFVIAAGAMA